MTGSPPLPDLHVAVLAAADVAQVLADIAGHAEVLSVASKAGADSYAGEPTLDLAVARGFLAEGALRGLQVRYRFDGATWSDTFTRLPDGTFRLVRMAGPLG